MSDTPFTPPPLSGTGASSAPPRQPVRDAPVIAAPPALSNPEKPVTIAGTIAENRPNRGEIRIKTAAGDITVQAHAALPPGTDVSVELRVQQASLRATIAVERQKDAQEKDLAAAVKPSPEAPPPETAQRPAPVPVPLATGMELPAVILPPAPDAPQPAPPPVVYEDITVEQAATIVEAVRTHSLAQVAAALTGMTGKTAALPAPPADVLPALWQVLNTKDIAEGIEKLPAPAQQSMLSYLRAPAVVAALQNILPAAVRHVLPQQTAPPAPPAPAAPPAPVPPDTGDDLLKMQTPPRQTTALPVLPPALIPGFGALLPMIQTLAAQVQMPQKTPAAGLPKIDHQNLLPLPQNMVKLHILSLSPPRADSVIALPDDAIPQAPAQPPAPQTAAATPQTTPPMPQTTPPMPHTAPPVPPPASLSAATDPQAAPPPPVMTGIVESVTAENTVIIRADDGQHYAVKTPLAATAGSEISFTVTPMTPPDIMALAAVLPADEAFDPLTSRLWPAMEDALRVLTTLPQAEAAAAALRQTLPNPAHPARMTPTTLFFLAALRIGTVESWLGDNILQALRQAGRRDIAERLGGDFARISQQSQTALSGEWRAISMPVLHDEQLSQLQFFIRQQPDRETQGDDGRPEKMTRFIVNLTLSRMGDMQLDGLLHRKKFDMILRTGDMLPFDMRQEIMQAFAAAVTQAGMEGGISFQTRADKWMLIPKTAASGTQA